MAHGDFVGRTGLVFPVHGLPRGTWAGGRVEVPGGLALEGRDDGAACMEAEAMLDP